MPPSESTELEAILGHSFVQAGLLDQALTHGSLRHEQQTGGGAAAEAAPIPDNERLEFLGDAVAGMLVAELLYRRYPELQEGELTRLRAVLVSRRHLGNVGLGLGLGKHLRLGKAEERSGGRKKAVLLANCMEALVAALYLEGGLATAAQFVERHITGKYVDELRGELREKRAIGDYKSALQELLQARGAAQPEYVVQDETGPDHRKRFHVAARISMGDQVMTAAGIGSTKKKAEQEAARMLYERATTARSTPRSAAGATQSRARSEEKSSSRSSEAMVGVATDDHARIPEEASSSTGAIPPEHSRLQETAAHARKGGA